MFILMCYMILLKKYNNAVHRTIKMKPIDVTSNSYAEYNEDSNETNPKLKTGYCIRILRYENIFTKRYTQNCIVSKIKNTVP